ncbi:MAG TPA: serine hydrolase [Ardenticatenaceae bacterium]|nr:serine hydrolase [Ardenticatenaceae bacterium]
MTEFAERIGRQLAALDARTALYARHLASRQELAIRADEPVNPLSTIKIAIMILAYRDADAGLLDLDERYTLLSADLRRGTGLLHTFAPGLQPTYRDLVTQTIVTSDNTATDVMIARLGLVRVNQMLADLGYSETRLQTTTGDLFRRLWELADPANEALSPAEVYARGFPADPDAPGRAFGFVGDPPEWLGRTPAREMGRLLEQLAAGKLASPKASEEMQRTLLQQFYRSRLPQRIEERVAIGHKTGDWAPIAGNDVGILYSRGGPIVIALFITHNRGPFAALEAAHSTIAEAILDHWEHA